MDNVKCIDRIGQPFYYVAQEQGYFREEGIDFDLITGMPSYCAGKMLATDYHSMDSFASADSSISMQLMSEQVPVFVAGAVLSNVVALASLSENPINEPGDLEGKTVGVAQGSGEAMLLPILLKEHGVDITQVHISHPGPGIGKTIEQAPQLLINGYFDAIGGYVTGTIQDARYLANQRGTDIEVMRYAEFGIEAYEMCLLFHKEMIEGNPDLVRRILRAVFKGVAWLVDHPEPAAEILHEAHPSVPLELASMIVSELAESVDRPEVAGNGLGWTDQRKWERLKEQLIRHRRIVGWSAPLAVTNQFLEHGLLPARVS